MKCKWCPYLATESLKRDGKPRTEFDDLKLHVAQAHPVEYRDYTKKAWYSAMESGRKVQALKRTERRLLENEVLGSADVDRATDRT